MRAVCQRVSWAAVRAGAERVGEIEEGTVHLTLDADAFERLAE